MGRASNIKETLKIYAKRYRTNITHHHEHFWKPFCIQWKGKSQISVVFSKKIYDIYYYHYFFLIMNMVWGNEYGKVHLWILSWIGCSLCHAIYCNLVSSWILCCNKADNFMFVNLSKVICLMTEDVKVLTLLIAT